MHHTKYNMTFIVYTVIPFAIFLIMTFVVHMRRERSLEGVLYETNANQESISCENTYIVAIS